MRVNPITINAGFSLTWKYRIVTTDRLLSMDFNNYQYTHWMTPWQISGLP
jgi:hypothetical protein